MNGRAGRQVLEGLYRAALAGVDPKRAVFETLAKPRVAEALAQARRVGIFAVGKAAAAMFRGAAGRGDAALIVLPRGFPAPAPASGELLFASHPEPDRSSLQAARHAVRFFTSFGADDLILSLVSGGTSSLLALPRRGWTLERKRRAVRRLIGSGASIAEVNRLRQSLSAIKAGRLGRRTRARVISLVLSDVPGDEPALVGSGPTVRGGRRDIVLVVGSNLLGLKAAACEGRRRNLTAVWRRRRLAGEAFEEGARFARSARRLAPGEVLLAGGETTVTLSRRHGRGGRNLEFALGAALELEGSEDLAVLSAGSDGIDGSSQAAGGFVDGTTVERAWRLGLDPRETLQRHDSEEFFSRLGALLITGATGTNVADWAFAVCRNRR